MTGGTGQAAGVPDARLDYNGHSARHLPPGPLQITLMNAHRVSWTYYGDQFNLYLTDRYDTNPVDEYRNICNWAQYSTSIMSSAAERKAHLADTADFCTAIANASLPAVSYVKPSGLVDGNPASLKIVPFEGFVKNIVDAAKADPKLWNNTAIFITLV